MAAYSRASSHFPTSFVESQNSLLESNAHGGGSNGGLRLHGESRSSDVGYGNPGSFEYGFVLHGESQKNVTASTTAFLTDSRGEVHRQFERGILDIFIHHAIGIHNICIYENQDVYAKFSLSHNPEEALCTRVVKRGGKNPVFNQSLQIAIEHPDSVLRFEIWMSSQARNYLEDQLLGFVQVPLSSLVGKGKHTQEFALSSTELFHSHAGTIKLTFMYHEHKRSSMGSQILNGPMSSSDGLGAYLQPEGTDGGSMASGISALSSNSCQNGKLSVSDYGNVEFQDMQAIAEDQQLVCNYLSAAANKVECKDVAATVENGMITGPPFLQMGSLNVDLYRDRAGEEQCRGTSSMTDDCQLFSYSRTPISNAENNLTTISDISEMKTSARSEMEVNSSPSSANYPTSSSSQTASGASSCQDFFTRFSAPSTSSMQMESSTRDIGRIVKEIDVLRGNVPLPLVNMSTESEPKVVQQEIVDMYMKSMQQFTEALAKMQLPMDMDIKPEATPTKNSSSERDSDESGKKNSQRVFYGSRAFF